LYMYRRLILMTLLLYLLSTSEPTDSYTLSLHDALPICQRAADYYSRAVVLQDELNRNWPQRRFTSSVRLDLLETKRQAVLAESLDRKSTRLNSSHVKNSYAVLCLKKKKPTQEQDANDKP